MQNSALVIRKGYISPFSERGYFDARLGFPYTPEYETWTEKNQRNYENGRLRACEARLIYQRAPLRQTPMIVKRCGASIPRRR